MYFQNILSLFGIFLFVNFAYSSSTSTTNIREKGSSYNNFTVDTKKNTVLSSNNTDIPSSFLHRNVSTNLVQVAAEGGGIISPTVEAREGDLVLKHETSNIVINGTHNLNLTQPKDIKPVHESVISTLDVAPQQDDEKPSVPKKGVSFNDSDNLPKSNSSSVINNIKLNVSNPINTTSTNMYKKVNNIISNHTSSTNATVIHKKPLVTESDSDYINMSKSNEEASKETIISIDQVDPLLVDKKSNRSDYIVPIVAVILSVPLVAILASILYKRGTDWWQHRNYKRMDFLIEGMYHN